MILARLGAHPVSSGVVITAALMLIAMVAG
jgi:hypothetical protein